MAIEKSIKSFNKDLQKMKSTVNQAGTSVLSFEDALEVVREELKLHLKDKLEEKIRNSKENKEVVKNKDYLAKLKEDYRDKINSIVYSKEIKVRDYNLQDFIEEMVDEFAGYSILSDAMRNKGINNIYCNAWDVIYVNEDNEDHRYTKTVIENGIPKEVPVKFRSPKHYKDFVERLIREAGKEINNGENKVVDFDLYEDRYNALSKAVTPKDFALTIRKHAKDHIKLPQMIKQNVVNQKVADFIGTLILGESSLIYAGITGSGKSTSIRAFLNYYIGKTNKRVLVCEDTQELFLDTENTLEMVTSKSGDPKFDVDLNKLVITALRLGPKYIVIGEVRGVEAESAVEASSTGHSTIFSMHAGEPIEALNRLITKYIMAMPSLGSEVVERIVGTSVDYIGIQDDIPGIGRRLTSLTEVSYNYDKKSVALKPLIEYNFKTDDFDILGRISPEKAKKLLRRGVKYHELTGMVEGWD